MNSRPPLATTLMQLDGQNYGNYRRIQGRHHLDVCDVQFDHIQGDPFASPSHVRFLLPRQEHQVPEAVTSSHPRTVALQDYLARSIAMQIGRLSGSAGSGKSGLIHIDAGKQEIIERTAVLISREVIEVRLQIGLPANGRRIRGREAKDILTSKLPHLLLTATSKEVINSPDAHRHIACYENYLHLQRQLPSKNLVCFVSNNSRLVRKSGASDVPSTSPDVVPFRAPNESEVTLELLDGTPVHGLGIPRGVTVIIGGGFHGKSTLLQAIERGIYAHIPGDGRELVVTDPNAIKIRAEDGRSVASVNISSFISTLPLGRSTSNFSTTNASGSTSQAANIVESLQLGASTLLLDEDTCASNFMIRDARMQSLVTKEPIVPFIDTAKPLFDEFGISSVLVMGGCGDYLDIADMVILMEDYRPSDCTTNARQLVQESTSSRKAHTTSLNQIFEFNRRLASQNRDSRFRVTAKSREAISVGKEALDVRYLEQLVDPSQTRTICCALNQILRCEQDATVLELLKSNLALPKDQDYHGNMAQVRLLELGAALNRLRSATIYQ